MGTPKALLHVAGTSFVRHMAYRFLEVGIGQILITVPDCDETAHRIQNEFLDNPQITFSRNLFPERELLGSVQTAIIRSEAANGLMIMPVDVPVPSSDLLRHLLQIAHVKKIACLSHKSSPAHPLLLGASYFKETLALSCTDSLRTLLARHPVTYAESDDANLVLNINTPEDYARFANPSLK